MRTPMHDLSVEKIKFVPRQLRCYLEVKSNQISYQWKKFWAVLTNEVILLYKNLPVEITIENLISVGS
jgi:hypothetical protein